MMIVYELQIPKLMPKTGLDWNIIIWCHWGIIKIRTKLVGGFAVVALIGAFLGVPGLYSNGKLTDTSEEINVAVNHVNSIYVKNREGIDVLIKEVSRFKVE